MNITLIGKLLHVYDASSQRDQNRFGIQILKEAAKGDTSDRFQLETYKLPKNSNPNRYQGLIGSTVDVSFEQWKSESGAGFFIRDEKDIKILKQTEQLKSA